MTHACAGLAIEVLNFEAIKICDGKAADTQTRQREKVATTNAPHPGYGDPFAAQHLLLCLCDPAQVAGECRVVIEH